jgi:HEAT repeat protein
MRPAELAEMMIEEPSEAEAAIAELVSSADVEQLTEIAREAPVQEFRLRAIEGLADVGGPEATDALIEMLQQANTGLFIGGTEQQREQERKKERLVQSLSRARGVPARGGSQREIAEFIEACRGADEPAT